MNGVNETNGNGKNPKYWRVLVFIVINFPFFLSSFLPFFLSSFSLPV